MYNTNDQEKTLVSKSQQIHKFGVLASIEMRSQGTTHLATMVEAISGLFWSKLGHICENFTNFKLFWSISHIETCLVSLILGQK